MAKPTANDPFLRALRRHQARVSITVSTVRGQGTGVLGASQQFLSTQLKLRDLRARSEAAYIRRLDRETDRLQRALPPKSRSFGLARKLLNIYIRDCVYSRMLCAHYRLEAIEPFLEVPLDSFTGKALNAEAKSRGQTHRLPIWRSIKDLEREESDRFQAFASELAEERGHARVHLDVLMWGARE